MVRLYDYKGANFDRTFDTYDYVDCFNYMDVHDVLKLYKHGYSKVTDHACREIRHGRLSRAQGNAVVHKHEHHMPRYLKQFGEWLDIKGESLRFMLDRTRSPLQWSKGEQGEWTFHGWSSKRDALAGSSQPESTLLQGEGFFEAQSSLEQDRNSDYIVIGKGYPEVNHL